MGEKNFHFHRVVFVILNFEEGWTRNFQKKGDQNFKIFNIIYFFCNFTFPTVTYNRGKVLESAQEISRCFVLWEP